MTTPGKSPQFLNTRWSLVLHAGDSDEETAQRALSELCEIYWYPIYAFVRRGGHSAADAEDLTQDFFAGFLQRNDFAAVDRSKGRLRSYLLGALKHFLASAATRAKAQKRGGGQTAVTLDSDWAESQLKLEPVGDQASPEKLFDRRWALTLLDRALTTVAEAYEARGKAEQFQALEKFLAWNSGEDLRQAADALGISESAFRVALHRLRQRYRKALRREVAETVGSSADLDSELQGLATFFQ
jgi:RNA polymerase sigma-70 factor (ECF subfamily)